MDVTQEQIDALYDADVMSVDGDRLGPVRQVYVDDQTGAPTWVTVRTGWFGGREHPVPLEGAERTDEGIRVSASGDEVREAPTVEEDEHLTEARLAELYLYYALVPPMVAGDPGADETSGGRTTAGQEPGPATPAAPAPRLRRHPRTGMG